MIKRVLSGIFVFGFIFLLAGACYCQEGEWKTIKSNYTIILLHPDVDEDYVINSMKNNYSSSFPILGILTAGRDYSATTIQDDFDKIYVKAQKILDMYPQNVFVKIKIFQNQRQLIACLSSILGHESDTNMISYYAPDYGTIYTSEDAISPQIIAHEMGHFISENYFSAKIPKQIQELLAQYVETHLND